MSCQILIIDDDPVNNLICEKVILGQGFAEHVTCFCDAVEALKWLCEVSPSEHPDMMLLDINLPTMSGWEFLEQLKTRLPEHKIRIYMMSSSASLDDKLKAEVHPALAGFVMKPLTAIKLELFR